MYLPCSFFQELTTWVYIECLPLPEYHMSELTCHVRGAFELDKQEREGPFHPLFVLRMKDSGKE